MNERNRLAEQLEAVLAGTLDLNDILDDAAAFGEATTHCYHGLQHFLIDTDLRAKDAAYRSMQESEMRKLIRLLRSEATPAQLGAVHFDDSEPEGNP